MVITSPCFKRSDCWKVSPLTRVGFTELRFVNITLERKKKKDIKHSLSNKIRAIYQLIQFSIKVRISQSIFKWFKQWDFLNIYKMNIVMIKNFYYSIAIPDYPNCPVKLKHWQVNACMFSLCVVLLTSLFSFKSILQCSLETWGSWIRISQSGFL